MMSRNSRSSRLSRRSWALSCAVCVFVLGVVFALPTAALAADAEQPKYCRPPEDGNVRSGCPQCISRLAAPSDNCHFSGDYVGGDTLLHGQNRCTADGTWGWDYDGLLFAKHIWLGWSHGARYQGGTGAYRTDGPKLLHDAE
jgi:hypothetical protein